MCSDEELNMDLQDLLMSLNEVSAPLLVDKDASLSGQKIVDEVERCALSLAQHGVSQGVPVLLNMNNDISSVITLLAAWKTRAVVFIGNPYNPIQKVHDTMRRFDITFFVGSAAFTRTLARGFSSDLSCADVSDLIELDNQVLLKLSHANSGKRRELESASIAIFSSGSTGEPKAIVNSFENIYQNAKSHGESIGLRQDDVVGCALPLYYSYGLIANFLASLIFKCTIVLSNFSAGFDNDWFSRYKISVIALTPFFAKDLTIISSSLRVMTLGGDALPIRSAQKIRARHPGCEMYSTYGLTEAGPRVSTWRFDHCELPNKQFAPLGDPLSCCSYYLDCAAGLGTNSKPSVGELVIDTETRMLGYYYDGELWQPKQNSELVYTGDVFEQVDGHYYFVARDKDIIVQNGEKIYPAAVEAHLTEITGVVDARIVGCEDPEKGEVAEALLQLDIGTDINQVIKKLKTVLPRSSMPSRFSVVDKVQRERTGKKSNLSTSLNGESRLIA